MVLSNCHLEVTSRLTRCRDRKHNWTASRPFSTNDPTAAHAHIVLYFVMVNTRVKRYLAVNMSLTIQIRRNVYLVVVICGSICQQNQVKPSQLLGRVTAWEHAQLALYLATFMRGYNRLGKNNQGFTTHFLYRIDSPWEWDCSLYFVTAYFLTFELLGFNMLNGLWKIQCGRQCLWNHCSGRHEEDGRNYSGNEGSPRKAMTGSVL